MTWQGVEKEFECPCGCASRRMAKEIVRLRDESAKRLAAFSTTLRERDDLSESVEKRADKLAHSESKRAKLREALEDVTTGCEDSLLRANSLECQSVCRAVTLKTRQAIAADAVEDGE